MKDDSFPLDDTMKIWKDAKNLWDNGHTVIVLRCKNIRMQMTKNLVQGDVFVFSLVTLDGPANGQEQLTEFFRVPAAWPYFSA